MKENNSEEMRTQVQTYLIEETTELIHDLDKMEQWESHVRQLGLKGQEKIRKPEKSPIPFLCLNTRQRMILDELCPMEDSIHEYDKTPIPVEILDLVALAQREGYFHHIIVKYDDRDPDPAVVGMTGSWKEMPFFMDSNKSLEGQEFKTEEEVRGAGGNRPSFYCKERYLIGRWADVKESFEELGKKAKERFITRSTAAHEQEIRNLQRKIEDLESEAANRFGTD